MIKHLLDAVMTDITFIQSRRVISNSGKPSSDIACLNSSIGNEVIKTISNFERTKTQMKPKPTNKTNKSNKKELRQQFFAPTKTFKRVKTVCFAFWCFLCVQNIFVRKKNTGLTLY